MGKPTSFDFPTMIKMRTDRLAKLLVLRAPKHIIRNELGLVFRAALAHEHRLKLGQSPSSLEGLKWLREIINDDTSESEDRS